MKLIWPIFIPGYSVIGRLATFASSSVMWPSKPASTKPAVFDTNTPPAPARKFSTFAAAWPDLEVVDRLHPARVDDLNDAVPREPSVGRLGLEAGEDEEQVRHGHCRTTRAAVAVDDAVEEGLQHRIGPAEGDRRDALERSEATRAQPPEQVAQQAGATHDRTARPVDGKLEPSERRLQPIESALVGVGDGHLLPAPMSLGHVHPEEPRQVGVDRQRRRQGMALASSSDAIVGPQFIEQTGHLRGHRERQPTSLAVVPDGGIAGLAQQGGQVVAVGSEPTVGCRPRDRETWPLSLRHDIEQPQRVGGRRRLWDAPRHGDLGTCRELGGPTRRSCPPASSVNRLWPAVTHTDRPDARRTS